MTFVTPIDRPKSARNRFCNRSFGGVFVLSRCFLDFSVIGLSQISFFFSFNRILVEKDDEITHLREALLEITEEVSRLHGAVANAEGNPEVHEEIKSAGSSPTMVNAGKHDTKGTLQKLQNVNSTIQQYKRYCYMKLK